MFKLIVTNEISELEVISDEKNCDELLEDIKGFSRFKLKISKEEHPEK